MIKPLHLLPILLGLFFMSCSGPKVVIEYLGNSPYPPANSTSNKIDNSETSSDSPYKNTVVIISFPEPKDGNRALRKKITYPNEAIENGIEGSVTVQFFINENGTTSGFNVIEGIGYGCDEAVISAIKNTVFEFSSMSDARFLWLVTAEFKL